MSKPGLFRVLGRGLTKRCARCGAGHLFTSWTKMRPSCPRCGLRFEREEGAWLGGIVINMGLAQTLVVAYLVIALVMTWPDPPLVPLIAVGAVLVAAFSLLFVPFSKTTWVAIELWMRSLSPIDLADVDRMGRADVEEQVERQERLSS